MGKEILIFGAGAIGRGYLPHVLQRHGYRLSFVESNQEILKAMQKQKSYQLGVTKGDRYEFEEIHIGDLYAFGDSIDMQKYDVVFSCVGPNNCYKLADYFKEAKAVISCENDADSAKKLRTLSKNPHIYFGIPDVITSNTAPEKYLAKDPLTTITENGVLVLEKGEYELPSDIIQISEKEQIMHWMCKLFIHNAPHAMVAYLGYLRGHQYIHEACNDPVIEPIISEGINELTEGLIKADLAEAPFAREYAIKEMNRFKNRLLFDTIERVAREPLRKISKDNRLILGLQLSMFAGFRPKALAIGVKAALEYDHPNDEEAKYLQELRKSSSDLEILRKYSGIERLNPLGNFIIQSSIEPFRTKQ